MHGRGEGTPLLRGRQDGENPREEEGGSAFQQPAVTAGDGAHTRRRGSRGRLSGGEIRARSHPVLLAVAAVGAVVLVVVVGLMSTSGPRGVEQPGQLDGSFAATRSGLAPGEESGESTPDGRLRDRTGGAVPDAGAGQGGGSTMAGGGWRSQASTPSGTITARFKTRLLTKVVLKNSSE